MNKNRPFSLSFSSIRINAVAHEKENYLPPLRYKKTQWKRYEGKHAERHTSINFFYYLIYIFFYNNNNRIPHSPASIPVVDVIQYNWNMLYTCPSFFDKREIPFAR